MESKRRINKTIAEILKLENDKRKDNSFEILEANSIKQNEIKEKVNQT